MEEKKIVTTEELEAARLDLLKNGGKHRTIGMVCSRLAIFCGIGLCPAIIYLQSGAADNGLFAVPAWCFLGFCAVGLVVFFIVAHIQNNEYMKFLNPYNAMFKTRFLPGVIESRLDKVHTFEPQNGLSREIVIKSGIFPNFDKIATNDYLRATHKGVNFEYCDMQLQEEQTYTDSDGDTHTSIVTVFLGIFIVAEFDHFADTPVFIKAGGGKGNVSTEYTLFNNTFSVFCDNPVDALRILTPQMMDDILEIKNLCKKPINIAFSDDKIYFNTEPGRDLLEVVYDIKKTIPEAAKLIDEDIDFITGILDLLNMRNLKSKSSQRKTTDEDFKGNAVYQNEQN
jgi:hypothetical protein